MQIVSMTAEHVSRLAELEKLCFSEPWSEKSLTEEIDNPAACFLVGMQQDEVVGYGGMHTVVAMWTTLRCSRSFAAMVWAERSWRR